jgi:hypothetical protein
MPPRQATALLDGVFFVPKVLTGSGDTISSSSTSVATSGDETLAVLIEGLFSRTAIGVTSGSFARSRRASSKELDFGSRFAESFNDSISVPAPASAPDPGSRGSCVAKPNELTVDCQQLSEVLLEAPTAKLCFGIPVPVEMSIARAAVMGMEEAGSMPKGKDMG